MDEFTFLITIFPKPACRTGDLRQPLTSMTVTQGLALSPPLHGKVQKAIRALSAQNHYASVLFKFHSGRLVLKNLWKKLQLDSRDHQLQKLWERGEQYDASREHRAVAGSFLEGFLLWQLFFIPAAAFD